MPVQSSHEDVHVIHDHHNDYNDNFDVLGTMYPGVGPGVVDITSYGKQSFDDLLHNGLDKGNEYGLPMHRYKKRSKRKHKTGFPNRNKRNEFKGINRPSYPIGASQATFINGRPGPERVVPTKGVRYLK